MLELATFISIGAASTPQGALVPLVVGLAGGLLLWLLGVKLLKPVFALVGAAIGAFSVAVLLPLTGWEGLEVGGVFVNSAMVGAVGGAVIGALVAFALFRFVIMIGSGVVFAVAGTLIGLIVASHTAPAGQTTAERESLIETPALDAAEESSSIVDDVRERLEGAAEDFAADEAETRAGEAASRFLSEEDQAAAEQHLRDAAERSRAFLEKVRTIATDEWEQRSPRDRAIILGSGVVGLVVGMFLGVVFTKRATAVFTALLGSALWIPAAVGLLAYAGVSPEKLDFAPTTWAVVWGGISVIGVTLQLGVMRKTSSDDSDDNDDD